MVKKDKLKEELTEEQKQELEELTLELSEFASILVEDYKENPSEASGSLVEIHEDSPYLYDWLEGDKWKKVLTHIPKRLINKKDKDASD